MTKRPRRLIPTLPAGAELFIARRPDHIERLAIHSAAGNLMATGAQDDTAETLAATAGKPAVPANLTETWALA